MWQYEQFNSQISNKTQFSLIIVIVLVSNKQGSIKDCSLKTAILCNYFTVHDLEGSEALSGRDLVITMPFFLVISRQQRPFSRDNEIVY